MKLLIAGLMACAAAWAADSLRITVDGRPFLMLAGELHNSSASSLEYMEPIWPRLKALHLNTVLASVSWELLEPREGSFDFRLVDGLVEQARSHDLHLVLLWFGSWKNGRSSYVPMWVKTDTARFPRAVDQRGNRMDVLSPLSGHSRDADARAFAALMRHLREVDGSRHTVLMVQAENEVGMPHESRDRSPAAMEAWNGPVAEPLLRYLAAHRSTLLPELDAVWGRHGYKTSGTWPEVFGGDPAGDEVFMAWQMASYINAVADAGKREYPLPVYVNAWLVQNDRQTPGEYPSGGPVSRMMDVWHAAAPRIDLLAPDIYLPDFAGVCASYTREGNPLFIPEASRGPEAATNVFEAIGRFHALGFSPFGIDSLAADHPIGPAYALLDELAPAILAAEAEGKTAGFAQGSADVDRAELGPYRFEVRYPSKKVRGGGLIVEIAPDEFYVAGRAIGVRAGSIESGMTARIGTVDEGRLAGGTWTPGRRLNGDETGGGGEVRLPDDVFSVQRVRLYRHPK
jgi:beta-galactosidase GanA